MFQFGVSLWLRDCVITLTMVLSCTAFADTVRHADPNKVLKYAFEVAETGFDPAQISDWYSSIVNEQIFDTPLQYDYQGTTWRSLR